MKIIAFSFIFLLSISCKERQVAEPVKVLKEKGDSLKEKKREKRSEGKEYVLHPIQTSDKSDKTVSFEITPKPGFKINEEYPWTFSFPSNIAKSVNAESGIKLQKEKAQISLELSKTTDSIDAIGSFSVCNDEKCLIYRDEKVTLKK